MPDVLSIAVLQRVCTAYRVPLFRQLSGEQNIRLRLFIGDSVPEDKINNASDLTGIDAVHLPTRVFRAGSRTFVRHTGLEKSLSAFRPDVILSEGESNLLSLLAAFRYRKKNRHVGLIHWSLGGLPGQPLVRRTPGSTLANMMRRRADALLTYSTFGKAVLAANGHPDDKVFVATNVGDVASHLAAAAAGDQASARNRLGIPQRFVAMYAGSLGAEKRPEVFVQAAKLLDPDRFFLVVAGGGEGLEELRNLVERNGLNHVHVAGHVAGALPDYYAAADAIVVPGRGGMVISEAMAYALPVVVWQADGTEQDLVIDGETGVHLNKGDAPEIVAAIQELSANREATRAMGQAGQDRLRQHFGTRQMVDAILAAASYARTKRSRQTHG